MLRERKMNGMEMRESSGIRNRFVNVKSIFFLQPWMVSWRHIQNECSKEATRTTGWIVFIAKFTDERNTFHIKFSQCWHHTSLSHTIRQRLLVSWFVYSYTDCRHFTKFFILSTGPLKAVSTFRWSIWLRTLWKSRKIKFFATSNPAHKTFCSHRFPFGSPIQSVNLMKFPNCSTFVDITFERVVCHSVWTLFQRSCKNMWRRTSIWTFITDTSKMFRKCVCFDRPFVVLCCAMNILWP